MSREAMELQEQWEPKPGDMYARKNLALFVIHGEFAVDKTNYTWLPRQEDLQEFSLKNGDLQRITDYTNTFCKFIKKQHKEVTGYNNSWSKLWLLFVMETVYNKTWTGNGWVKL
jgi:hypothetical protein